MEYRDGQPESIEHAPRKMRSPEVSADTFRPRTEDGAIGSAAHHAGDYAADLVEIRAEIESRYGRCMLKLQRCEHLTKTFVAHHAVAGPPEMLMTVQARRVERLAMQTMGAVSRELLSSFLKRFGTSETQLLPAEDSPHSFAFATHLELSESEFGSVEQEIQSLVLLRNRLAHHFLTDYSLTTPQDHSDARQALIDAEVLIEAHLIRMKTWASWLSKAWEEALRCISSQQFWDFVCDGISPDGTVDWPRAGCVRALFQSSEVLAVYGWTGLNEAAAWIAKHSPAQTPKRYGCRRWRQVLHACREFEVQKRVDASGTWQVWFRPIHRCG